MKEEKPNRPRGAPPRLEPGVKVKLGVWILARTANLLPENPRDRADWLRAAVVEKIMREDEIGRIIK